VPWTLKLRISLNIARCRIPYAEVMSIFWCNFVLKILFQRKEGSDSSELFRSIKTAYSKCKTRYSNNWKMWFDVPMVVKVQGLYVNWVFILCIIECINHHFRGLYCGYLQGNASNIPQCKNPEDQHLNWKVLKRQQNLK
jgi:hypothetical protein